MIADIPSSEIERVVAKLADGFGYYERLLKQFWVNKERKKSAAGWFGFAIPDSSNSNRKIQVVWLSSDELGTKNWYICIDEPIDERPNQSEGASDRKHYKYKFRSYNERREQFKKGVGILSEGRS